MGELSYRDYIRGEDEDPSAAWSIFGLDEKFKHINGGTSVGQKILKLYGENLEAEQFAVIVGEHDMPAQELKAYVAAKERYKTAESIYQAILSRMDTAASQLDGQDDFTRRLVAPGRAITEAGWTINYRIGVKWRESREMRENLTELTSYICNGLANQVHLHFEEPQARIFQLDIPEAAPPHELR